MTVFIVLKHLVNGELIVLDGASNTEKEINDLIEENGGLYNVTNGVYQHPGDNATYEIVALPFISRLTQGVI